MAEVGTLQPLRRPLRTLRTLRTQDSGLRTQDSGRDPSGRVIERLAGMEGFISVGGERVRKVLEGVWFYCRVSGLP